MMAVSIEHQSRVLAFQEATERKALAKARAIFELVSCLALARPFVTDPDLQRRMQAAVLNSHICFQGDVKPDLPADVIPIWSQDGFDPKRAGQS
jgi:hypothetical protein